MEYQLLLDLATELGYRLSMCGAETYRVEESITRVLRTYGIESEVFAIPNNLIVSIETNENQPMTRMRRIGFHGNDLNGVEWYSSVSRRICSERPEPSEALQWLDEAERSRNHYSLMSDLLGYLLSAFGFCLFFGGTLVDAFCAGICGIIIGLVNRLMDRLKVNQFFRIMTAAFFMAVPAYIMCVCNISHNADTVIIGSLMLLVPGLLFVNGLRDIIFGDTNSGVNRIVQVILIAMAIALGTGIALNIISGIWGAPVGAGIVDYPLPIELLFCLISCAGFSILFNIHGIGILFCSVGSCICWSAYAICIEFGVGDIAACGIATMVSAVYAEVMARIRKFPAISYLVISLLPLIPGAGIYHTMNYAVQGNMAAFSESGTRTIALAGAMAVGILIVSTGFRIWSTQTAKLKHR